MARVTTLERQLSELQESQQKSEVRLRDVTRTLSELEEKKRYTDDKLNKAVSHAGQQVKLCVSYSLHNHFTVCPLETLIFASYLNISD